MTSEIAADVGQILWIGFEGSTVPDSLSRRIAEGRCGAVILFGRNIPAESGDDSPGRVDLGALIDLNRTLHDAVPAGRPPLWIAVDQEGGRVQRVRAPATVWPAMLRFDCPAPADESRAQKLAFLSGRAMARELSCMGFDIDFAPVLDVHTNPRNPVIGDRSFATEPERVARRALAFARGLEQGGIVGCGKHFPGHGDTETDSHLALPRLNHDRARLDAVELLPFRRAVAEAVPMLMTAHVVFAAIDDTVPATLSHSVITELLRLEMGFAGIIVSDDLDMRAIADNFGIRESVVSAIRAGCDALLLCRNRDHQEQAYEALLREAESSSEFRSRVGEAATRIRAAKERYSRAPRSPGDLQTLLDLIAGHRPLVAQLEEIA